MARHWADYDGRDAGEQDCTEKRAAGRYSRVSPMKWALVAGIGAATTIGDVLKAKGMKEHGEIHEFGLGAFGRLLAVLARNKLIILSVLCMAVSFFTFMALVSIADLSFAVPATAITYVF